ncbi:MAG: hypothetical protein Q7S43_03765, partial [bacterium]|nr:hypothetical protein [bacterium]
MNKHLIAILLVIAVLGFSTSQSAHAVSFSFIKNIVDVLKTSYKSYKVVRDYGELPGYVPHTFPFGGHIISSERACSLKWTNWVIICATGCYIVPIPGYFHFSGRAIEVGPPIPSNGKVIDFPSISDIYRNKQEDRVGPWALAIGFTPFPLDQINDALGLITIPLPAGGWADNF